MTIAGAAQYYGNSAQLHSNAESAAYTNWDGDSSMMCVCDRGYFGADCSKGTVLPVLDDDTKC